MHLWCLLDLNAEEMTSSSSLLGCKRMGEQHVYLFTFGMWERGETWKSVPNTPKNCNAPRVQSAMHPPRKTLKNYCFQWGCTYPAVADAPCTRKTWRSTPDILGGCSFSISHWGCVAAKCCKLKSKPLTHSQSIGRIVLSVTTHQQVFDLLKDFLEVFLEVVHFLVQVVHWFICRSSA